MSLSHGVKEWYCWYPDHQCVSICLPKKSLLSMFYMGRLEFPNHEQTWIVKILADTYFEYVSSNFILIQERKVW